MVIGSVDLPGAVIMVNNDLSASMQNRLVIQLHIDEVITGEVFDLRLAAEPDYPKNVRILNRRLLIVRSFLDHNNRNQMDVIIYIKNALASVEKNCFGSPAQTYPVKNLTWGDLCIYNTNINRTCHCSGSQNSYSCSDGYGCLNSPYYPAKFDPAYLWENHWYNKPIPDTCIFGKRPNAPGDKTLCREYFCNSTGIISGIDCRIVKS